VDIEEGALLPGPRLQDASLLQQLLVKRRAREGGLHSDLHLVEAALPHELGHQLEDLRPLAVQSKDEAAVDRNVVPLDGLDGALVAPQLPQLPVAASLQAVEAGRDRALQTDENLRTASVVHHR